MHSSERSGRSYAVHLPLFSFFAHFALVKRIKAWQIRLTVYALTPFSPRAMPKPSMRFLSDVFVLQYLHMIRRCAQSNMPEPSKATAENSSRARPHASTARIVWKQWSFTAGSFKQLPSCASLCTRLPANAALLIFHPYNLENKTPLLHVADAVTDTHSRFWFHVGE